MNGRRPLDDLAAIVTAVNAAARDRARVAALMDLLAASDIFDPVVALSAKGSWKTFFTSDLRGDRDKGVGWQKWPLRRLFETMRLRRIRHPQRDTNALAIPLNYGDEGCVVLACLSDWAHEPSSESFFEALENFSVPSHLPAIVTPEGIPISPIEPHIVCFGLCPSLQAAVDSMLFRRGWMSQTVASPSELRVALETARAEVVLLDFDHQYDAFETLLRVHGYVGAETKLLAFGEQTYSTLERQALVDCLLTHDASESEVFATLKRFTRLIPELRKTRLRAMTTGFEMALDDARTPSELSVVGARHAASVMHGWASMHLVSNDGATYAAEHPRQRAPVLKALPKTFLSDAPIFQLRADERFYHEVSDDRRVVGALERLHPVSAASIPLRFGDRRIGTLISVSRDVAVDSSTFEALDGFSRLVTRRFDDFTHAATFGPIVERSGVWECVRHGALEFAAYRSRSSKVAWDYRTIRADLGVLVVGDDVHFPAVNALAHNAHLLEEELWRFVDGCLSDERIFVAACNPVESTVTYAASGFPAPLLFDAAGPAGALSVRGSVIRGTVAIMPPAGLLVWDMPLQRWLVRESVEVQSVTETLEDLRPPGLAIVVTRSPGS